VRSLCDEQRGEAISADAPSLTRYLGGTREAI